MQTHKYTWDITKKETIAAFYSLLSVCRNENLTNLRSSVFTCLGSRWFQSKWTIILFKY